jgi:hypothetical protein
MAQPVIRNGSNLATSIPAKNFVLEFMCIYMVIDSLQTATAKTRKVASQIQADFDSLTFFVMLRS